MRRNVQIDLETHDAETARIHTALAAGRFFRDVGFWGTEYGIPREIAVRALASLEERIEKLEQRQ